MDTKRAPESGARKVTLSGQNSDSGFRLADSGFRLADLALSFERRPFLHLETHRADGTGDRGSWGEAAGIKVAIAGDFAFDDGLLGFQVTLDRRILTDRQAAFGIDVADNRSVKDQVGRTVQIAFDLDVAGKMAAHGICWLEVEEMKCLERSVRGLSRRYTTVECSAC